MKGAREGLPDRLRALEELALDLHWTWSHSADSLWRRVDAGLWAETRNPWLTLQLVPAGRLRALAADGGFLAELDQRVRERRQALESAGWFRAVHTGARHAELHRVAYFSMEFGLHEALPLFSGGLGVLAGDHLKTASDLDVPVVGVGILWQEGYFRQVLDASGHQQELYPYNDPASLPVRPLLTAEGDPLQVALELPGRLLRLRGWEATVGRRRLYLLDANHPLNVPADRGLTGRLYGSDPETRLLQELILGIGGWRLLEALGLEVDVCHLNEGHAAFVVIERARRFMEDAGVSFREALWATRAGNVFTTHTSVDAGFDSFGRPLIDRYTAYFDAYVQRLGISWPELLALGRRDPADAYEPFSMAYLALRGCARVNGVSRLHGEVSRRLFQPVFPRWPEHEVPVTHVTNGVHVPSWDSPGADELWTAAAGPERWRGAPEKLREAVARVSDRELWGLRTRERADLVRYARGRLRGQLARQGETGVALASAGEVLDDRVLTLGFARRFTAYKRPVLLLADPDRLARLLTDPDWPVQIVVAGKAHPADGEGKRLVAEWVRFARRPDVRRHVVFIEDHDLFLAKELVQGVDVWLNTPRRPWEACGTSGMKVLVNGGLNLSTLDGWWAEAYEPAYGWAVGDGRRSRERGGDAAEAEELYRVLEDEVVPLFYHRDPDGVPRHWLARVRASMAALAPRFSGNRMLREYVEAAYLPAAADFQARAADGAAVARDLAAWEARLGSNWHSVRIHDVEARADAEAGVVEVSARVFLGGLAPGDVRVEVYADAVGGAPAVREPMRAEVLAGAGAGGGGAPGDGPPGPSVYVATLRTSRPPHHFTPRMIPWHPRARVPLEATLIRWAE